MIAEATELEVSALDPRPCEHCCLLLNDHFTIEGPEGPEHFCQPLDVAIHLRALHLQETWERADPRDAWKHTGEAQPKKSSNEGEFLRRPNRTPQSTVDAFLYLVSLKDPDRLVAWLQDRERDRSFLLKLLEAK